MLDYKGDKEYPVPDKRILKTDFPSISELYRYGEEVSVPESADDLRCKYTEKEPTPLLKVEELEGYCVPPLGITVVCVNGVGMRAGKAGWIYPAGTFRQDRHTIGMELGGNATEMVALREQSRRDSFEAGVIAVLEKKGVLELDVLRDKSPQVIEGLASWAMQMIENKESSRDAVAFLKLYIDKIEHKDKVLKDLRKKPSLTIDQAREWLTLTKNIVEPEVVEVKLYDVSGEQADGD